MTGIKYLATPYSRYPGGIEAAFREACILTAKLLQTGTAVYSPIAHTHQVAIHGGIDPMDLSIWLPFDEHMMRACDTLIVAHLPGWQESKGIAHEVKVFETAGKPIFDLDPGTLTMAKRRRLGPVIDGEPMPADWRRLPYRGPEIVLKDGLPLIVGTDRVMPEGEALAYRDLIVSTSNPALRSALP